MNICILHGYLLTGTGSNIYVQNLARQFCRLGHNVYLLCQEPHPEKLDFVNKYFLFEPDNTSFKEKYSKDSRYPGKCFVFRPDLGGLLLVYVYDRYGKLKVKEFTAASLKEIENYIAGNTRALKTVLERYSITAILSNHLIASPQIARRAVRKKKIPYFITLHGSAFNFSVKPDRRLHPYAREGIRDAHRVFAVSEHNRREIVNFLRSQNLDQGRKIGVIPCGVNTDQFHLLSKSKNANIEKLSRILKRATKSHPQGNSAVLKKTFYRSLARVKTAEELEKLIADVRQRYNERFPDTDVVDNLRRINWKSKKIVLFLGKYLWSKGVQLIVASLPFVLAKVPDAHFVFVGFGSSREALEVMIWALSRDDRELFRYAVESLSSGRRNKKELAAKNFFKKLFRKQVEKRYFELAQEVGVEKNFCFTGILTHTELRYLLPCADVLVAPSIFPEAFGMVGIEAMACGVWPLVTYQTGFKEIKDILRLEFKEEIGKIKTLKLSEEIVFDLAEMITEILTDRRFSSPAAKRKLRRIAVQKFSWPAIAHRYLDEFKAVS